MTNSYFRNVPDFDYVNRSDSNRSDGDYVKLIYELPLQVGISIYFLFANVTFD